MAKNRAVFLKHAALVRRDLGVIDARQPAAHQAIVIEFPQFVAIGSVPLAGCIVPLVFEAHGNPVFTESPQRFLQTVIQLFGPFPLEERFDFFAALEELGAIAPFRIE
jgi:hypothetical protein